VACAFCAWQGRYRSRSLCSSSESLGPLLLRRMGPMNRKIDSTACCQGFTGPAEGLPRVWCLFEALSPHVPSSIAMESIQIPPQSIAVVIDLQA
jgi:hypothetical protein